MSSARTLREVLLRATETLTSYTETPKLDAEVLLQAVAKIDKTYLITRSDEIVDDAAVDRFHALITRRKAGEPVAYLLGTKEFYGRDFLVNQFVLCPRPETELLIERALEIVKRNEEPVRLIDLGTGSGCIAVTMVCELKKLKKVCGATAVDSSAGALLKAYQNAEQYGVGDVIEFCRSDWFSAVPAGAFDLLLANPPYVPEGQGVSRELDFEPQRALYAGKDGLDDYREILKTMDPYLKKGSVILFEIGHDQAEAIKALANELLSCTLNIQVHQDLAGCDRVLELRVTSLV